MIVINNKNEKFLFDKNENVLICGDCLDYLSNIPDKSIDMILCDLPYGITQNKWDIVIPFDKLWKQYNRIIKERGAILLFGIEPFSSMLITSNLKMFKYNWIWQKNKKTGFFNAKKQPLNDHELISVFYKKQCLYIPQKTIAEKIYKRGLNKRSGSDCYGKEKDYVQIDDGLRYPTRIIYFDNNNYTRKQLHPTQKPVDLCEYLIKTYTNENELVLDNCMGSGSTIIACENLNRRFIGIEKDNSFFNIALNRYNKTQK